jgi:CDP-diacylglycerol--glycerol-3-phosphate 3-phosphatidyltransferase
LWIVYTDLGLISVVIPIIVVIRGMLTDSIRSVAMQYGYTAHKMMQTGWGKFIVASSAMRTTYSVTKISAFLFLNMGLALRAGGSSAGGNSSAETVLTVGVVLAWLAALICIIRGLPVVIEAPRFFASLDDGSSE